MAQILLNAERDLLDVGSDVVQVGGKPRRQNGQRKAAGQEVLIDELRVRIIWIEALLAGKIVKPSGEGPKAVRVRKRALKGIGGVEIGNGVDRAGGGAGSASSQNDQRH